MGRSSKLGRFQEIRRKQIIDSNRISESRRLTSNRSCNVAFLVHGLDSLLRLDVLQKIGVVGASETDMSVNWISDSGKHTPGNCLSCAVVTVLDRLVSGQSCGVVANNAFQRVAVVFMVLLKNLR
jgi:hypothetical protein